jgi:Concanavalin A-like lectin/glucanases superfamily
MCIYKTIEKMGIRTMDYKKRRFIKTLLLSCCIALLQVSVHAASIESSLFPLCWGGAENQELYFATDAVQRLLIVYRNDMGIAATDVEFRIDLPEGYEVVHGCASAGHTSLKTTVTQSSITRNSKTYTRFVLPMWDIAAGFGPSGSAASSWGYWPGWYSYLIIRGPSQPGRDTVYWQLSSAQSTEPEQQAVANVLPIKPLSAKPSDFKVGAWLYRPLSYGIFSAVEQEVLGTLGDVGVGKVMFQTYNNEGNAYRWIFYSHQNDMTALSLQWWPYSVWANTGPPVNQARAVNASGSYISGNAWCPTYMVMKGVYYQNHLNLITNTILYSSSDGFMLDYEGAAAPGYTARDICFCAANCRPAFEAVLGSSVSSWPTDVRPGGSLHQTWLNFRSDQHAAIIGHIADAARVNKPDAVVETWSGGYYTPYPSHQIYSLHCSDISKFAAKLSNVTVGTYTYPTDPLTQLVATLGFGTDPANWGSTLADMIKVVRDTVAPVTPTGVIPCAAGSHSLGGSATPLASTGLLRYEAIECLIDGAQGFDIWGLGFFEDGRYLCLMNEIARVFDVAEEFMLDGQEVSVPVVGTPAGLKSKAFELNGQKLVILLNTSPSSELSFSLSVAKGKTVSDPVNDVVKVPAGGELDVTLAAIDYRIFVIDNDTKSYAQWWKPYTADAHTLLLAHFDGATGTVTTGAPQIAGEQGEIGTILGSVSIDNGQADLGQMIQLSTDNDQLNYGDPEQNYNVQEGTVEFWFKPINWTTGAGEIHVLFMHEEVSWNRSMEYIYTYSGGPGGVQYLYFRIYDADDPAGINYHMVYADIADIVNENPRQWHHLAATWRMSDQDGSSMMELYIDGTNARTVGRYRDNLAMPMSGAALTHPLRLGSSHQMTVGASCYFDEFRISDTMRYYYPEPAVIAVDYVVNAPALSWLSDTQTTYGIVWSEDYASWQPAASLLSGTGSEMNWADLGDSGAGRLPMTDSGVAKRFYKLLSDQGSSDLSATICAVVTWTGFALYDYQVVYRAVGTTDPWKTASAIISGIDGEMNFADYGDSEHNISGAPAYEYAVYRITY